MYSLILTVTLSWLAPAERENGTVITADEIGGYEVRADCNGNSQRIKVGNTLTYELPSTYEGCTVYVSVYDINGLYSSWSEAKEIPKTLIESINRGGIR